MELTSETLATYLRGLIEIQNPEDGYLVRGEIAAISLEGEGNTTDLVVKFGWVAKGVGFPPFPNSWNVEEHGEYRASLIRFGVRDIGAGRLLLNAPLLGEVVILFPPSGSKLVSAKVESLDLDRPSGKTA